jgi:hypothetical protein
MNFRPLYALLLVSSLVELGACKDLLKKRDPDPAPSAAPVAVTPPAVVAPLPTTPPTPEAPAQVAVDETAVPTSQDFEDEAFDKVTPANFRVQFTLLKTDIGKP